MLSPEDQVVQSMPDASPTKWHRAHVTWFFEQFLLQPYAKDYRVFDERFAYLYNSYYVSAGPRQARPQRGLVTRPSAAEVAAYRAHVDEAVAQLIETANDFAQLIPIIEIGLNHEQQHQELLLTDILHAFSLNATHPAYDPEWQWPRPAERIAAAATLNGIETIGHDGDGFCFDNERPAHQIVLRPVRLAPALVTNGEWLDFMADGGYTTPTLWLSDGFATVEAQGWNAPGYWRKLDGAWFAMTLGGLRRVEPARPVCHVSYYEADAFARWSGKDLPSEGEWEVAAKNRRHRRGVRRRLAMDAQRLCALSRLPGGARRARRIQRQVHGQSNGIARLVAGDPGRPFARLVSQFLLSVGTLAIQRIATFGIPTLSGPMTSAVQTALRAAPSIATADAFAADVLAGLTAKPKRLPPKYFYDLPGSALFERITQLPEYYPTRCELALLRDNAPAIASLFPPHCALIEFGSGSSKKARILLGAAATVEAYVPVDISGEFLQQDAALLRRDFPRLAVHPLVADFTQGFDIPAGGCRVAAGWVFSGIDHRQFRAA